MKTTDIHQHFDVEYDKANVISSYPSFLPEEKDVWLNKAYSMIISQKLTGNNYRKVAFEGDVKRISDLQGLVKTTSITKHSNNPLVKNSIIFDLSTLSDYLYYVNSTISLAENEISEVLLINHNDAQRFKDTDISKPWIARPVAEIESDKINIYYDSFKYSTIPDAASLNLTYIHSPAKIDIINSPDAVIEVGDNVVLEIINLAVILALENIESQRMDTKGTTMIMQE